jgi:hypothetical protein
MHRTNQSLDKFLWDVVPLVHPAATVVFKVDFDDGKHVYRVHPINVQLVTDPVIMSAKEDHGCDYGSESLGKHGPRDIFSLLQKGHNDMIKNIVSVFYSIQYSLNKLELSATNMTHFTPDDNTSASKTVGLVHTLVRKTFPTPAVNTR